MGIKDYLNRDSWDIDLIKQIVINEKIQENLYLEYKGGSCIKSESFKSNLRKWVSAFQNSDGGLLIIGVPEDEEHHPLDPDGVNLNDIPGESVEKWIEDILKSKIYPNLIPFPRIFTPIPFENNKVIIVIEVFRTQFLLHKALDFGRFYHRHNFSIEPMDEWEERAILYGRVPPPRLNLTAKIESYSRGPEKNIETLTLKIENVGWGMAKYLQISIIRTTDIDVILSQLPGLREHISLRSTQNISEELFRLFNLTKDRTYIMTSATNLHDVVHPQDFLQIGYNIESKRRSKIDEKIYGFLIAEGMPPHYFSIEIRRNIGEDDIRYSFNTL